MNDDDGVIEVELPWMKIAKKYEGVARLKDGSHGNPIIIKFFSESNHPEVKDEEVAWCAAFVGACLFEAGIPGDHSLWAQDYCEFAGSSDTDVPAYGDIVVFRWNDTSGHVGFFLEWSGDASIKVLGGNQSNMVCERSFMTDHVMCYRRIKI